MPVFLAKKIWRAIGDFAFPLACEGCGRVGQFACVTCLNQVPLLSSARRPGGGIEALHVAYPYAFPMVKGLIRAYKYESFREAGSALESLSRRWSHAFASARLPPDAVVVPVPLHPLRVKERGFNQSEAIARGLAVPAGLIVVPNLLRRVRYANPQARSDDRARIEGQGMFAASRDTRGRTVVIVDDVWTTGATMSECVAALRKAGAARIIGFALADAARDKADLT